MSVDEKVKKGKEIVPVKKPSLGAPKLYQVTLVNNSGYVTRCQLSVLHDAFNMSARECFENANAAAKQGRQVVLVSTREASETKAAEANALCNLHFDHDIMMAYVGFKIEPAA